MVLKCEIGTAEGKPQVEEYGLDGLAASAEAVLAGLGPLVAGLAQAFISLATFVGAERVTVARATPSRLQAPLVRALRY